jgi:tetratricopeptide (TPR) repeat protein
MNHIMSIENHTLDPAAVGKGRQMRQMRQKSHCTGDGTSDGAIVDAPVGGAAEMSRASGRNILAGKKAAVWGRGILGVISAFSGLCVLVMAGCDRQSAVLPVPPPTASETGITEGQWLAGAVVGRLADLVGAAALREGVAAPFGEVRVSAGRGPDSYGVEVNRAGGGQSLKFALDLAECVWSAKEYVAISRALQKEAGVEREQPEIKIPANPIVVLSEFSVEAIESENQRISKWLSEHPRDAEGHEQAAMLLGTLGMRENSGRFWDARGFCNRATAHLAFAQALRNGGAVSDSGRIAELLIGLLCDRKRDCAGWISQLRERAAKNPELLPWVIAGGLRNERDGRQARSPGESTLLERVELFRANCESMNTGPACDLLFAGKVEPISDWPRILLQFQFGVGDGHRFTEMALPAEAAEIVRIFPEFERAQTSEQRAAVLNPSPVEPTVGEGSGAIAPVIDRGTWALFFQRHLCHAIQSTHEFMRDKWGVPDAARSFKTQASEAFGALTLFPLVGVMLEDAPMESNATSKAAADLIQQHPEWVPDSAWSELGRTVSRQDRRVPKMGDWFRPGLPTGTAYSFYSRSRSLPEVRGLSVEALQKLYGLAPTHYGVAEAYLKKRYGEKPDLGQMREILGGFMGYNLRAMRLHADLVKDRPEEYAGVVREMAKWDPNANLRLSRYLAEQGRGAEAAEAFEDAMKNHADAVRIANGCEWVVSYYYGAGNQKRALEIATFAAEVYSQSGLETMGRLQEKMGNLSEAERYLAQLEERYDDKGPLLEFYARQSQGDPAAVHGTKWQEMKAAVFPEGIREVTLESFKELPSNGVAFRGESESMRRAGLSRRSIVVALDGIQTQTMEQYVFVRALKSSPEMRFIIYENGRLVEKVASVEKRRFNVDLENWVRRGPQPAESQNR